MKATKTISKEVKTAVRRNIKSIHRWRRLGVEWKVIVQKLNLNCRYDTLSNHYRNLGLI